MIFFPTRSASSPSEILAIVSPSSLTTSPFLFTLRPSKISRPGKAGSSSAPSSAPSSGISTSNASGTNSTLPITFPSLSTTSPFSLIFFPAKSAISPSETRAITSPSSFMTSPFLLTLNPSRISKPGSCGASGASESGNASGMSSTVPMTFPSLSSTSPWALIFFPARSVISPSETRAIGSPSSFKTSPFLLTLRPSSMSSPGSCGASGSSSPSGTASSAVSWACSNNSGCRAFMASSAASPGTTSTFPMTSPLSSKISPFSLGILPAHFLILESSVS